jgi:hypothetical protein
MPCAKTVTAAQPGRRRRPACRLTNLLRWDSPPAVLALTFCPIVAFICLIHAVGVARKILTRELAS